MECLKNGTFYFKAYAQSGRHFYSGGFKKIKEVVGLKAENKEYGRYGDEAKTLMQVIESPEKEYTKREWNGIIFSAGAMTKIEPELAPTLKGIIERFHTFKG